MKKRGFALIAAIFFIILVSTVAVTSLATASMTARDTANIYTKEQAMLLAQSATEFAVMAMQAHVYNGETATVPQTDKDGNPVFQADGVTPATRIINGNNCLERINLTYPGFNIVVQIYYINNALGCVNDISGRTPLASADAAHMALVDVTVSSTNAGDLAPIVYNRRTLQKP